MAAFKNCTALRSVTTSSRVKMIRQAAFAGDTALEEISLGSSISTLGSGDWGDGVFSGCTSLKMIDVPASVRYIHQYAFSGCTSLKSASFKFGLLEIGNNAFEYCSVLEAADIPNSVTRIGDHAFRNSFSLKAITIPNSVVDMGDATWYPLFDGCEQVEIRGYAGSKAEQYAGEKENLTFTTLTAVPATNIVFDTDQVEMKKGEWMRLAYTTTPENTTDAITWASSNTNIVSINQVGEITARNAGSVNISATTTSGLSIYMEVIVANDPNRVAFDDNRQKTISIGQSITQTAKAYEGNIIRSDIPVTYESSNPSIATVDGNGVVKGLKEGTVRITARATGEGYNLTDSYTVRVVNSSGNGNGNSGNNGGNNGGNSGGTGNGGGSTVNKNIGTIKITRKNKTLTIKTVAGATVKVSAKKSVLGKSSKSVKANSKGVAKIKFKKKIKNVTVTVRVSKTGYLTKTQKKKFKK